MADLDTKINEKIQSIQEIYNKIKDIDNKEIINIITTDNLKEKIDELKELYREKIKTYKYEKYKEDELNNYSIEKLKEIIDNYELYKDTNYDKISLKYNDNNSCYFDCLMVALFNKKNYLIEKLLFESKIKTDNLSENLINIATDIIQEFRKLYDNISNRNNTADYNIDSIIRKIKEYLKLYNNDKTIYDKLFSSSGNPNQADFTDIISIFELLLSMPQLITIINEDTYMITYNSLLANFSINDYTLHTLDIIKYNKDNKFYIDYNTTNNIYINDAPFLLLHFPRIIEDKFQGMVVNSYNLKPDLKIKLMNNNTLYLNSIILYYGDKKKHGSTFGHYKCLYECNNIWYEYNDLNVSTVNKIGEFNNILTNIEYTSKIAGLFYT
jgi:hypothetical protein